MLTSKLKIGDYMIPREMIFDNANSSEVWFLEGKKYKIVDIKLYYGSRIAISMFNENGNLVSKWLHLGCNDYKTVKFVSLNEERVKKLESILQ